MPDQVPVSKDLASAKIQAEDTSPEPADFKPRDNPAFILHGKLSTSFQELPVPSIGPDEVLVEVKHTGICGSDVHFYLHAKMGLDGLKGDMCLGHEASGVIAQIGSNLAAIARKAGPKVDGAKKGTEKHVWRVGDRVALEPGVSCRMCVDCRGGQYQICEHMAFAAYPPFDGTLQRYYKLPADLVYPLPESVDLIYGAMMEPLSVAVHGIANVGKLRTSQNVLIFGAGPVGLLAMAVAKGLGAGRIIAVDINEARLNFAKSYAATDIYIPNADESRPDYSLRAAKDLLQSLDVPARGPGSIDLVMDATGAEVCIQMGINAVRPGGVCVQTGFGPPDITIPLFRLTTEEIQLKGCWRYGSGDYPLSIDLVARGLVDLKPLLTHTFPFKQALEAFEATKNGKGPDGKTLIKAVIAGPE